MARGSPLGKVGKRGGGMNVAAKANCAPMKWTIRLAALMLVAAPAFARDALPPGFVYLRDIDPSIAQDMRYAGPDNFTGAALPGYAAPECVLRREVALALERVKAALAKSNLSLKTYDCYRPARAVAAMARWARGRDNGATKRFYPALDKHRLFALGYIAAQSAHSTGVAVDLTIIPSLAPRNATDDARAAYGPCTSPQRAPDTSLDMGTGFDCFDRKSSTAAPALTPEQKRARDTLLAAMRAQGFKNYFREWWHFTYGPRGQAYDVPIGPR
ncbi:MAG: M15 family metallopeptidase [Pseudolabrys sp.]